MIKKGSRYESATLFQPGEDGRLPFRGIRPRAIGAARPVLEHYLRAGERPDLLSAHYYNEPQLWWRILDANPDVLCAGDLAERDPADPLLVPRAREQGSR
ncbi:MAG TPA: hypothetical protein VKE95_02655 [Burkholderiales bacterium]|nr:hypothetical protein [Burkholderiales bacterium]